MIARPLELASRLRSEPRSLDWLFFVNGALIVLFFSLFGSRFVLAPGFTALPGISGATAGARTVTHYITVQGREQIFAGDGLRDLKDLNEWLVAQAKTVKRPVLLIQSNRTVDLDLIAHIASLATEAGFEPHIAAVDPKSRTAPARR